MLICWGGGLEKSKSFSRISGENERVVEFDGVVGGLVLGWEGVSFGGAKVSKVSFGSDEESGRFFTKVPSGILCCFESILFSFLPENVDFES